MPPRSPFTDVARCFAPAVLTMLIVTVAAWAYPKPASVPFRWELDFRPGELRLYIDPVEGEAYWYFTYVVTNETGAEQIWAPSMTLFTDVGEILASGRNVPARIEEDLLVLLGNELMETQSEAMGTIFQGREHAIDGLVIWPAAHTDVNEVTLFVAGISGETARVINPVNSGETILRKTQQRDYLIRGSALARRSKPLELVGESWIMR